MITINLIYQALGWVAVKLILRSNVRIHNSDEFTLSDAFDINFVFFYWAEPDICSAQSVS